MTDNPILDKMIEYTREDTALDIRLSEEGGKYYLSVGEVLAGPMDHGQCWHMLVGIQVASRVEPTLLTEKVKRERSAKEQMERILNHKKDKESEDA